MRALVPKWHTEKNMGSRENLWESGMEIIVGRLGIEVYALNKKAYVVYLLQLLNKYSVKKQTNKQ